MTPTELAIQRLRRDAHVHRDSCYGPYEPCGEHHAHDMQCGGRRLYCRQADRPDLVLVVAELDRLKAEVEQLKVLNSGYVEQLEHVGQTLVRAKILTPEDICRQGVRFAVRDHFEPQACYDVPTTAQPTT